MCNLFDPSPTRGCNLYYRLPFCISLLSDYNKYQLLCPTKVLHSTTRDCIKLLYNTGVWIKANALLVTYSYSYCQRWVKFFDMVNSRRKSTACWEWSIVEHWPKNRWISWAEYQFLYQTTLFIWWLLLSCYAGQNGLAMKNVLNLCFSIHLIWKYHIKTNPLEWEWARGLFSYCHCAKVCGVRRAVTNNNSTIFLGCKTILT